MVRFTIFFTFGIWLLQQQAALPVFASAWQLAVLALLLTGLALRIATRTSTLHLSRSLLLAALACGSGFYYAAAQSG